MSWAFDLSSYEDVKENAGTIYERLENGSMPCDEPWPEEQVQRFKAWIDEGMPP
jgi:exonuclease VII small subunit